MILISDGNKEQVFAWNMKEKLSFRREKYPICDWSNHHRSNNKNTIKYKYHVADKDKSRGVEKIY